MTEMTILVVDDERTVIRLCQKLLERASYQVITAMDPIDALKILEKQKIDLLLSDIRMPVMDGFELITQAKQYQPELPVVVMTGFGSIEYAIQALHRGVEGLILKPFENTAELAQTVQRVLEESRQKREAARLQALRPLFDVTERLLAETSPQPLEKLILNAVTGIFQATFAGIYRLTEQQDRLETLRTLEKTIPRSKPALQQRVILAAAEEGIPALYAKGRPNPRRLDMPQEIHTLLHEAGWETLLVVPVRRNNSHFLFSASRDTGSASFAEADLEMFVILARQAAVAMENARLYSDLKDYVRQVEESQRALIQAEKMAAVGRLVASLAHEINNPLQSVRNCLHLAERPGIEEDQRVRYLDMTNSELNRLVNTVRRMLDFYRPGGAEKDRANIQEILDQVLALLGPQLREQRIEVHLQHNGKPMQICVVRDQIQQVIFNLLINAMDAIEDAAKKTQNLAREIWIDVYNEPHRVRIALEDSGTGISPDLNGQLFEPFVSTKLDGTGLGLAVSYGIMERHKGRLTIIPPRYKGGACFEMILPAEIEGEDGKSSDC